MPTIEQLSPTIFKVNEEFLVELNKESCSGRIYPITNNTFTIEDGKPRFNYVGINVELAKEIGEILKKA
jgi:hypothetical protein